jgi:hypothetical protein
LHGFYTRPDVQQIRDNVLRIESRDFRSNRARNFSPKKERAPKPQPAQKPGQATKKQQPKAEAAKKKAAPSAKPSAEPTPAPESKKRKK